VLEPVLDYIAPACFVYLSLTTLTLIMSIHCPCCSYVTLMEGVGKDSVGDDALKKQLVAGVRETIGAFAAPDVIHWVSF
jgi:hypothetical protein